MGNSLQDEITHFFEKVRSLVDDQFDRRSDCKALSGGTIMTVPPEEASANYVPAAAVRRRGQALSGITGRKELVGGAISQRVNASAQLRSHR